MSELDEVKESIHGLQIEVAGLRPVVKDIHANMPRIATALETLAQVTEQLNSNAEDHKRIHYRISDVQEETKELRASFKELDGRVDDLVQHHLDCQADLMANKNTLYAKTQADSWLKKIQHKLAEDAARYLLIAFLGFLAWILVYHLPKYPVTAPIIEQGRVHGSDNQGPDQ